MAAKLDLAPLPPFDPLHEPSSLSQRWKSWTKRFQTYVAAMNITDDRQKRALLLYQAGPETQEIFETLTDTGDDYKTTQEKLDAYFSPKKNVNYEIFQFRQEVQQPGETVDQFATRLRKIAINCEFHDTSKEIKAVIIQNCQSKRLRRYALREDALTLDDLLAKARSLEASEMQATGMEKSLPHTSEEVNRVHHEKQTKPRRSQGAKPQQTRSNTCRQCGLVWPHKTSPCPAKGKTCRKCGKPNHFAKMCLTKSNSKLHHQQQRSQKANVNQVSAAQEELASSSDDEYLYTTNHGSNAPKIPRASVKIGDVVVEMVIDTGATTDILDEATYRNIHQNEDTKLQSTTKRLFAYGSDSQLTILGKFDATIAFKDKYKDTTIHVVQGNHGSLLSYKTAMDLGILDLHVNHVSDTVPVHEQLCRQHSGIFNGIGRLKGVEVKLHIDQSVPPVAQRAR